MPGLFAVPLQGAFPADERIDEVFVASIHNMPKDTHAAGRESHGDIYFANVLRESLGCAVITIDASRKLTGLNPKAEQLTHLRESRALGRSADILPGPVREAIDETFSSGKPIAGHQILLPDEDRGNLTVRITSSPIRAEDGKLSGVVIVLNDISAVQKWESKMRRLDRYQSVGTLSASMAHEVKNAFVAVKTFVELLLEQNQQADLAEVVRAELKRIDSLLSQMRKFSGPAKPAFSPIQLHAVLDKSLRLLQHLLEEKKITVTRSFRASTDLLSGDPDQLAQAFLNLLFNALDAMKRNGRLIVSTELLPPNSAFGGVRSDQPLLQVIIQDDGIGIPAEHMDRLFEPFFTTKPEGTGLGLAITRRIILEHHGAIKAQSEIGKGTTFTLLLPATV